MAAHGIASRVVVSGKRLLNPFRIFLHRVSSEILEEDLTSMKFLLVDKIPERILENCQKPTDLFSHMIKKCLIAENDLDLLEQLFNCINRSDLVERVRVFIKKSSSSQELVSAPKAQVTRELPAMGKVMVCFMLSGNNIDQNATLKQLKFGICAALKIKSSEISFVKTEEEAKNLASFIFQIPKNEELLNSLRNDALQKEDWLCQCGIQAVKVGGDASYIVLVPPLTHPPQDTQVRLSQPKFQTGSDADLKCKGFVDKHNLDLIVVVERIKDQKFHTRLKTQLAHLVEIICARDYNFRLALVCYQDHSLSFPNANTQWFTKEKDVMKSQIHNLNESRTAPSANGLADGLALVRDLATKEDSTSCRKDANKVCILLPSVNERTSLETYKSSHGHDVMKLCRQLAENSVTLYTVGVLQPITASSFGRNPLPEFFAGISLKTGGRYFQTQNIKHLPGIMMCAIKEDLSLERLIGTAHDIVLPDVIEKYGDINVEELTKMLKEELNQRSCLAKSIVLQNNVTILRESELARKLSYDEDMESACFTFTEEVKRLEQAVIPTDGIPQDVEMEKMTSDLGRITISKDQEITDDLSERLVRKVGHRTFYCTSS